MELEVFLNESAARYAAGSQDLKTFAEEFAGWASAPAEQTREFLDSDIQKLLSLMDKDAGTAAVIGFKEFPYTKGGALQGSDCEIEREYWLRLSNVGARYSRRNAASARPRVRGAARPRLADG